MVHRLRAAHQAPHLRLGRCAGAMSKMRAGRGCRSGCPCGGGCPRDAGCACGARRMPCGRTASSRAAQSPPAGDPPRAAARTASPRRSRPAAASDPQALTAASHRPSWRQARRGRPRRRRGGTGGAGARAARAARSRRREAAREQLVEPRAPRTTRRPAPRRAGPISRCMAETSTPTARASQRRASQNSTRLRRLTRRAVPPSAPGRRGRIARSSSVNAPSIRMNATRVDLGEQRFSHGGRCRAGPRRRPRAAPSRSRRGRARSRPTSTTP